MIKIQVALIRVEFVRACFRARKALDENGFNHIKIIVSSGFDAKKIATFEEAQAPVDIYGVGTAFLNNQTCLFSADLVELDGKNQAKFGGKNISNPRLKSLEHIFD